jgi:hypothetical protein
MRANLAESALSQAGTTQLFARMGPRFANRAFASLRHQQAGGARTANPALFAARTPARDCRTCGTMLTDKSRQLCPTSWPVTRNRSPPSESKQATRRWQSCALQEPIRPIRRPRPPSDPPPCRHAGGRSWPGNPTETAHPGPGNGTSVRSRQPSSPYHCRALGWPLDCQISACSRIRGGKLTPHRGRLQHSRTLATGNCRFLSRSKRRSVAGGRVMDWYPR